jgi:hypothetical protein
VNAEISGHRIGNAILHQALYRPLSEPQHRRVHERVGDELLLSALKLTQFNGNDLCVIRLDDRERGLTI